jgi:Phosphoinositide phospholipase C, Ca2+-dependent
MTKQVFLFLALSSASAQQLKLNEIQIVGTHNSYHSGISPNEMENLRKINPRAAAALDYRHPSLETQLNDGVRQLEIDVYADTKGGLFANPKGPELAAKAGLPSDPPFDPMGIMLKPGFKVLHVQDIDYRSNCEPFINCLLTIRTWSKAHRNHLPIFVLVENKDGKPSMEGFATPEPLTPETFDVLDAEVRSVFETNELITPDDVRGDSKTLEEAILTKGWPTLEKARGKVIFLLDQRRVTPLYSKGHPNLEGRIFFPNAAPGTPDAAFTEVNNSAADPNLVPGLIRKGYLVRTMTDPSPVQIRANDSAKRDASLASGAQILSTDYPAGEPAASGYSVTVRVGEASTPNARCNPILKPANCKPDNFDEIGLQSFDKKE